VLVVYFYMHISRVLSPEEESIESTLASSRDEYRYKLGRSPGVVAFHLVRCVHLAAVRHALLPAWRHRLS